MKYEINMKLPSLNEYIKVCRSNYYYANQYKARIEQEIGLFLMKMPKWYKPIRIHFTWVEKTKKRDKDNVAFAKKFILDSMQRYGKLENDNNNYIVGFTDTFIYGKENKVIIEVEEVEYE